LEVNMFDRLFLRRGALKVAAVAVTRVKALAVAEPARVEEAVISPDPDPGETAYALSVVTTSNT
jgi:hypothetical protein